MWLVGWNVQRERRAPGLPSPGGAGPVNSVR